MQYEYKNSTWDVTNPGEVVDAVDERQTNGQLGADDVEDND